MKCVRVLGVLFVALVAVSALTVSSASAVTFLLSSWLLNGSPITTPDLVEVEEEFTLTNLNAGGLGIVAKLLCSAILIGFIGPGSLDEITEALDLSLVQVNANHTITCTNTQNCESALIYFPGLPGSWLTELELISSDTGEPFADLLLSAAYLGACTVLGVKVEEECKVGELAAEVTNEAGGVDITTSDAFQQLAGLNLGQCGGRTETAEAEGLAIVVPAGGGTLTASE